MEIGKGISSFIQNLVDEVILDFFVSNTPRLGLVGREFPCTQEGGNRVHPTRAQIYLIDFHPLLVSNTTLEKIHHPDALEVCLRG